MENRAVGDVFSIFLLSLLAMFNPTLLAAVTIMMLLPEPRKLITGYLLGAYLTSIGLGMAIVFSLHNSSEVESSKKTLTPVEDLVFGAILVIVGWVVTSGRASEMKAHRRERKEEKHGPKEQKESLPERLLGKGSMRVTFAVGALLSLPGASYLIALNKIAKLDWPGPTTALTVIVFCLIQQLLLELPLFGFWVAPEWTERAIVRFREWISHNAARTGGRVLIVLGALLLIRGTVFLIAH
ncbi:MAG TPA: GAP family protein [Solirubrobacterales bacterium]|nr:GAP family protein [Solirubrobacterales bacterium]